MPVEESCPKGADDSVLCPLLAQTVQLLIITLQ